jgi:hypothetical protein
VVPLLLKKQKKKKKEIKKKEVFGVALNEIIKVQKRNGIRSDIPLLVTRCFQCIQHKFEEEGIFRKSGLYAHILELKNSLDQGYSIKELITQDTDCHTITGLLKLYIRELPNPLISSKLQNQLLTIMKDSYELEEKIEQIKSVLLLMDQLERNLLGFICKMLKTVSLYQEKNKMTVRNLAIVWAPTLLGSTTTSSTSSISTIGISPSDIHRSVNLNLCTELTSIFIAEVDILFNWATTRLDDNDNNIKGNNHNTSLLKDPSGPRLTLRTTTTATTKVTSRASSHHHPPGCRLSSSYSRSMIQLPTFTHHLQHHHHHHTLGSVQNPSHLYSIPCLMGTLSAEPTPQLSPRSEDDDQEDSTSSCRSGSLSATIVAARGVTSESTSTTVTYDTGSSTVNSLESTQREGTSSSMSVGEAVDIEEEVKEVCKNDQPLTFSTVKCETPRPNLRYCSARRKVHVLSHSDVDSNTLKSYCSPPLVNRHRTLPKTSPNKREHLSTEDNNNNSSFKKNLQDKKRLPTSPITKRTLKKRPGRLLTSNKRTLAGGANLPTLSGPIRGSKRITCYYQSNKSEIRDKISNFFVSNETIPYKTRFETTSPIDPEEVIRLVHSYETLLVINKIGAIRFIGSVSYLSDEQVKKLTLRRKSNSLKSPALFLKRDSILIVGWSEDIWSYYLNSKYKLY